MVRTAEEASLLPVSLERVPAGMLGSAEPGAWRRLAVCLWGAVLFHASFALIRFSEHLPSAAPPLAAAETFIPVALDSPPPLAGPAPGGGSEQPDPEAPARAVPEVPRVAKAVRPARRAVDRPKPVPDEIAKPMAAPTLAIRPDPVTATDSAEVPPWVPQRRQFIDPTRSVSDPEGSPEPPRTSRFYGHGIGANGGPGGPGSGWGDGKGVVKRPFAFGGTKGAFRGEVCFFEERVRSLLEIRDCRPVATFFTSTLNVPPRSFTEGFPGVTSRVEWFSIRYRGQFSLTVSGTYRFRLLSDDGAMLYIDGRRIINNDGQHPPMSREGTATLEAGEHNLYVHYYQGPRENIALQLFVTPPGGGERLLGPLL